MSLRVILTPYINFVSLAFDNTPASRCLPPIKNKFNDTFMSLSILQIVPRLPPAITGVGDYAYLLAGELRAAHGIQTHFLVCDPSWEGSSEIDGFAVESLGARRGEELEARLSKMNTSGVVLLQYVGYGYEKRGCPLWLANGIERWRRADSRRRLIVMFHELFAFGPPWRSSFWASYIQRVIAARLADIADCCVTNMRRFAEWLNIKSSSRGKHITCLPIFSTVGELTTLRPLIERAPKAVIFGGVRWVNEMLRLHLEDTLTCCRRLGIEEIITIGSPRGTAPLTLPVAVREQGFLSAERVVDLISTSRVGLMNYFTGHLAKSSVYAAYVALGIMPILPRANLSDADGCQAGVTYLTPGRLENFNSNAALQQVVDNAGDWYHTHDLPRTALAYSKLIRDCAYAC